MFPKTGKSPIIHFNWVFHYKPSILGYPYFWKHPYVNTLRTSSYRQKMPSTGWDSDHVPAAQGSQEMVLWEPLPKDLNGNRSNHGKNTAQVTASPGRITLRRNCRNPPKIYGGFDGFGVTCWGLMTLSIWWLDVISKWKELWKTDYKYSTSSEVRQNTPWGFLHHLFLGKCLWREMGLPPLLLFRLDKSFRRCMKTVERNQKRRQSKWAWLVGGFNPFEKYYSNWIVSPGRDEHKKFRNHQLDEYSNRSQFCSWTLDTPIPPNRFTSKPGVIILPTKSPAAFASSLIFFPPPKNHGSRLMLHPCKTR